MQPTDAGSMMRKPTVSSASVTAKRYALVPSSRKKVSCDPTTGVSIDSPGSSSRGICA